MGTSPVAERRGDQHAGILPQGGGGVHHDLTIPPAGRYPPGRQTPPPVRQYSPAGGYPHQPADVAGGVGRDRPGTVPRNPVTPGIVGAAALLYRRYSSDAGVELVR